MHFEIEGLDIELSDRNGDYFMINIIVYENTEDGVYETKMKAVYDYRQKVMHGFHRAASQEKNAIHPLHYRANNNLVIQVCNCTNNYRYSDDFIKHYQMHKANMDFHLFNMIIEYKGIE